MPKVDRRRAGVGAAAALSAAIAAGGAGVAPASADGCENVITSTHGTLTAKEVPGNGDTVSGNVDGSGCDIVVFVDDDLNVTVTGTLHDANRFGVYNDGNVVVDGAEIFNIGNHSAGDFDPNGVQTGVGVYINGNASEATGSVGDSNIHDYQKGGIVVNGVNAEASIEDNRVRGLGPFKDIAQNGIQAGFGATLTELSGNKVTDNIYTAGAAKPFVSTGILIYQAELGGIADNQVLPTIERNNDVHRNQANVTVIN